MSNIITEVVAGIGQITLDRPAALNALSLDMVRDLTCILKTWREDPSVEAVAIRGSNNMVRLEPFVRGATFAFSTRRVLLMILILRRFLLKSTDLTI